MDNGDLLNVAIFCVLSFSGVRAEHAHAVFSKDCKFLDVGFNGPNSPRAFQFSLTYDKNCRSGPNTRLEQESLVHFIPCFCFDQLKGNDLKKFRSACVKKPNDTECVTSHCPYGRIRDYFRALPDPFGAVRAAAIKNDLTLEHLKLFRARSAVADSAGVRRFLITPLGSILSCYQMLIKLFSLQGSTKSRTL